MKVSINKNPAREGRIVEVNVSEPFTTAIIDPPWPYSIAPGKKDGTYVSKEGQTPLSGFIQGGKSPAKYDILPIGKLASFPVGQLVGGYVFLWTTTPFMPSALSLLEEWGFEYITALCWGKWNKERALANGGDGKYGGVGFWFLGNFEICLLGKKKGMPSIRTGKSSLFLENKTHHSAKPDNVHRLVEDYLPGPYLELFGREPRKNWTVAGDQTLTDSGHNDQVPDGHTIETLVTHYGFAYNALSDRFKLKLEGITNLTAKQRGLK